jgi:methylated-DNA-[protein]-cysteine S-methyltransferase
MIIDSLPVAAAGTRLHRAVWAARRNIACGTTLSYVDLARCVDRPSAVRAVGFANGADPISIVVPCHRVAGADGGLTGYGGGIDRKSWLLAHEAAARAAAGRSPA